MSSVVPKVQGKPWRKHSFIDINRNELGVMITRDKTDFSVHQACMDYAHGKCLIIVWILVPVGSTSQIIGIFIVPMLLDLIRRLQ